MLVVFVLLSSMKVLKENNITSCDIDGTLVIWPKDYHVSKPGRLEFEYGDELVYLYPHHANISFLKFCSFRGDFIEVWSKHKYVWCVEVIKKLELEKYVDLARSKPDRHIDDKTDLNDIVGERVFFPFEKRDDNEFKS